MNINTKVGGVMIDVTVPDPPETIEEYVDTLGERRTMLLLNKAYTQAYYIKVRALARQEPESETVQASLEDWLPLGDLPPTQTEIIMDQIKDLNEEQLADLAVKQRELVQQRKEPKE